MNEVERAVFAANLWKGPQRDGIPSVVWQKLRLAVKDKIFIFNHSLTTGRMSRGIQSQDRTTEEAGQPKLRTTRHLPTDLFAVNVGKVPEAINTERISYLAETHHLLYCAWQQDR
jgi:hypothetical protein